MTFVERLKSWFSPREQGRINFQRENPWLSEQQYAQAIAVVRREHEQLARKTYWLGGFSWWYRLFRKEPRVRTTVAQQASTMDLKSVVRFFRKMGDEIRVHSSLPWWKRLFTKGPSRRDRDLFCYIGAQRYLSSNLESKPFEEMYRRSFLPMLRMRRPYNNRWYMCFKSGDVMRNMYWHKKKGQAKQLLEAQEANLKAKRLKSEVEAAKKKASVAKAWAEVAAHNMNSPEGKAGDPRVLLPAGKLGLIAVKMGEESESHLAKYIDLASSMMLREIFPGLSPEARKLYQEVTKLSYDILSLVREVKVASVVAKTVGGFMSSHLIRLQKNTLELIKGLALGLEQRERGVLEFSKARRRLDISRPEGGLYQAWERLFQRAENAEISDLVLQSPTIQGVLSRSQVASSIFRSRQQRRPGLIQDTGCGFGKGFSKA